MPIENVAATEPVYLGSRVRPFTDDDAWVAYITDQDYRIYQHPGRLGGYTVIGPNAKYLGWTLSRRIARRRLRKAKRKANFPPGWKLPVVYRESQE